MDGKIRNNAGFAIVEIMVSLVLVCFVLMAFTAVFPRMTAHRKVIREVDQAHALAMEAIEWVQADPLRISVIGLNPDDSNPGIGLNLRNTIDNTVFRTTFGGIMNDPNFNFSTTAVTVSWQKLGNDQSVTLVGVLPINPP